MNGLDLFSGIGGLSIGLSEWVNTVAYCESDPYAQGVLMSRMRSGHLDRAPIWDDVRTLSARQLVARVDIIIGGFPCQDISAAGRGAGLGGERSGLFFEIVRLVDELRPSFVFLENVPAITSRGLDTVVGSLTALGYDCRWTIVSAAELGAPHLRKRWFLLAKSRHATSVQWSEIERSESERDSEWLATLANADRRRLEEFGIAQSRGLEGALGSEPDGRSEVRQLDDSETDEWRGCPGPQDASPDTDSGEVRVEQQRDPRRSERVPDQGEAVARRDGESRALPDAEDEGAGRRIEFEEGGQGAWDVANAGGVGRGEGLRVEREPRGERQPFDGDWWFSEPDVGRVADGVAFRVHRLRCCGNGVVPRQAKVAFERLIGI